MNSIDQLIRSVAQDTLHGSLPAIWPEVALCVTIVGLLALRICNIGQKINSFYVALAGSLVALVLTVGWGAFDFVRDPGARAELFGGLLVYDAFGVYFRTILLAFAVLFVILTRLTGVPDREDGADFYALLLGAILGMCLMATANHLFMVFLAVEMASVPSYVLTGMLRRRKSSEAAMKYAVYGGGTAGVMLYGISLLAGTLGSCHLPTMAAQLADLLGSGEALADRHVVLLLGGLMLTVGLAFKLSAVPFHFWCPDVFEGATAEIAGFLSVASKAAALALLVRVALGLGYVPEEPELTARPAAYFSVAEEPAAAQPPIPADGTRVPSPNEALAPVRQIIAGIVGLLAAITCTFGNLAAYGQTNIKRLLAYSTIGHAGYMMMPVAAALTLIGTAQGNAQARESIAALAFYVAAYLFMNLGAFAVVALLRNALRSEEIADYRGLVRQCPALVICFCILLFSLIGLPPLAGFTGKFLAFAALGRAGLWTLFAVAGLNTVISLFYYLRVVKAMTIEAPAEDARPVMLSFLGSLYVGLLTAPVVLLGFWWEQLNRSVLRAVEKLFI